jgi:hypothetical protein
MPKIKIENSAMNTIIVDFFNYVELYLKTEFKNIQKDCPEYYNTIIVCNLLEEVKYNFEKKYLANRIKRNAIIKVELTQPQALAFNKALTIIPIPNENIYANYLRQQLIDEVLLQIKEPIFN